MRPISNFFDNIIAIILGPKKKDDHTDILKIELQRKADGEFTKKLRDFRRKYKRKPNC